jgi:membrane protein implicated in regulation of membrane protease activity
VFVQHSLVLVVLELHAGSWVPLVGMEVVASPVLHAVSFLCPVCVQVVSFCFLALALAPRWRPFEKE